MLAPLRQYHDIEKGLKAMIHETDQKLEQATQHYADLKEKLYVIECILQGSEIKQKWDELRKQTKEALLYWTHLKQQKQCLHNMAGKVLDFRPKEEDPDTGELPFVEESWEYTN